MPTGQDLLTILERQIDEEKATKISEDEALALFNEALADLSENARYLKTAVASLSHNETTIALPQDFIDYVEVRLDEKPIAPAERYFQKNDGFWPEIAADWNRYTPEEWPYHFDAYESYGSHMVIYRKEPKDNTVWLRYYAYLPALEDLSQTPKLPLKYHKLLWLYAAARFRQSERDELEEKRDFQTEYELGKSDLEVYTRRFAKKKARVRAMPRQPWL